MATSPVNVGQAKLLKAKVNWRGDEFIRRMDKSLLEKNIPAATKALEENIKRMATRGKYKIKGTGEYLQSINSGVGVDKRGNVRGWVGSNMTVTNSRGVKFLLALILEFGRAIKPKSKTKIGRRPHYRRALRSIVTKRAVIAALKGLSVGQ